MRTTENLNYASLCKKIRRILKVMVLESWTSEIHLNGYSHEVTERQRGQRCLPRVCISDGDKCCSFFGNQCTQDFSGTLGWGRGWGNVRRLIEYDGRLCKCLCLSLTFHRQDFECPCYLNIKIQNVRTVTIFENVDHIENKTLIRHLFIFFYYLLCILSFKLTFIFYINKLAVIL